jgi:hypothetical protein
VFWFPLFVLLCASTCNKPNNLPKLIYCTNKLSNNQTINHAGGNKGELDDERLKILEEREKWEKEKNEMQTERNEKDYQRAMAAVDNAILDLLPKTKEAKQTCDLLNRVTMSFDVVLEKGADQVPRVKVCVENSDPKLSILIDPQEFLPKLSLLKDEMMKLRAAITAGREYAIPERHDPIYLMFDNDFHLGTHETLHFPSLSFPSFPFPSLHVSTHKHTHTLPPLDFF